MDGGDYVALRTLYAVEYHEKKKENILPWWMKVNPQLIMHLPK